MSDGHLAAKQCGVGSSKRYAIGICTDSASGLLIETFGYPQKVNGLLQIFFCLDNYFLATFDCD